MHLFSHYRSWFFAAALCASPAWGQTGNVDVPDELLDTIEMLFPERDNSGAGYLSSNYDPNILVLNQTGVEVVFIHEGAGYRNTLGYFTYRVELNGDITLLSSNLVIPNVSFPSAGTLVSGDRFDLLGSDGSERQFVAGERIGFFLIADGWREEPLVLDWDPEALAIPSLSPNTNRRTGRGCYTTLSQINPETGQGAPELSQHFAMIALTGIDGFLNGDELLLTGVEDLNRRRNSDDDFNDLIFLVRSKQPDAISAEVSNAPGEGDDDGDGIRNPDDSYPNDAQRAFVQSFPGAGSWVLAYEDRYPLLGDADYNDVVLAYRYQLVVNAQGRVKDVVGTFDLVARGAGFNHGLGVHLPDLASGTIGTYQVERRLSDGSDTVELLDLASIEDLIEQQDRRLVLLNSTRDALPVVAGDFATNTETDQVERSSAGIRFVMEFDAAIPTAALGSLPFDPYIESYQGADRIDIHLPGFPGFDDRPTGLPVEDGPMSFIDDNGYPWALHIPADWRWPRESREIWRAYPLFNSWVSSAGSSNADWFRYPDEDLVSLELEEYLGTHEYTLNRPQP